MNQKLLLHMKGDLMLFLDVTVTFGGWQFMFFPRWVAGFAFSGTIYIRDENTVSKELLAHELVHCVQYREYGLLRFLYLYFYFYLKNRFKGMNHRAAYLEIPFEKQARELSVTEDFQKIASSIMEEIE